ncbi:MAG TPA: tetratricopeptide repeat protein [Geobacteraceae bacterium]|nr:tetratricopeptide repeat protein [Geobacteraceae bacterium]
MSFFRIVVTSLCLSAFCVALAAAADRNYRELYYQGVEHNKRGEYADAIKFYSKAIALKTDSASLFFVRGRAYGQNKEYDKAIRDLGKAIVLKPDYAEAYNIRGVTYLSTNQRRLAMDDFRKACSMGLGDACKNLR